jgi:hypothetical protein
VGVDVKCSMSLLQLDLPAADSADKRLRRALIDAITERTPTGAGQGQRSVEAAGLARTIARLSARFVIKDSTGVDD